MEPQIFLISIMLSWMLSSAIAAPRESDKMQFDAQTIAEFKEQEIFSDMGSKLQEASYSTPECMKGFSGTEITSRSVILYWKKGEDLCQKLRKVIQDAKVTVVINESKYSLEELKERVGKISKTLASPKNSLMGVDIRPSGLDILSAAEINTAANETGSSSIADGASPNNDPSSIMEALDVALDGIDYTIKFEDAPTSTQRYNDAKPYEGGIAICSKSLRCSSGFPVRLSMTKKSKYILTAGHCGDIGTQFFLCSGSPNTWTVNTKSLIGRVVTKKEDIDLMLIDANSLASSIWDGPINGAYQRSIKGWSYVSLGEKLCRSGSTSGGKCGLTVTSVWSYRCFTGSFCAYLSVAETPDGSQASFSGDSGGPVFKLVSSDSRGKRAPISMIGTISGHGGNKGTSLLFGLFSEGVSTLKIAKL